MSRIMENSEYLKFQLELAPDSTQCAVFRRRLREIGSSMGFDENSLSDLVLGVGEAFTNAIRHGSCVNGDAVRATILARPREIVINLHYRGDGFTHRLPDCDELCQMENGGLGRYIMYSLLDDVTYTFQLGFTSLRMVKRAV